MLIMWFVVRYVHEVCKWVRGVWCCRRGSGTTQVMVLFNNLFATALVRGFSLSLSMSKGLSMSQR